MAWECVQRSLRDVRNRRRHQFPKTLDEVRVDYPDAPANVPKDRIVDINWAMGQTPNDLVDPYEPFSG